jgi:hypothetical protein
LPIEDCRLSIVDRDSVAVSSPVIQQSAIANRKSAIPDILSQTTIAALWYLCALS